MVSLGGAVLLLAGAALALYLLYVFYGLVFRAFRRVGFTQGEATAILFGTLLLGFVNLPLARVGGWLLAVNVGGALVPLLVSYLLLRRFRGIGLEATVGATLVAATTFLVTRVTPEGIVSPFPLWLAPPLVAALVSLLSFWREETHAAPLAYVAGTLGSLVGADVLRLGEFLAQAPPETGAAVAIGGAAVFDMVFLAGLIAVGLDVLVFRELRRAGVAQEEGGPVVFRMSTPDRVLAAYDPAAERARAEDARRR